MDRADRADRREHWEGVYSRRPPDELTWYSPRLEASLDLIAGTGAARSAPVIDVGGGASTLVDQLLDEGFEDLTVLDVAGAALEIAKARLGARAARVRWLEADITRVDLGSSRYAVWHDRAVFHFLVEAADREAYLATLRKALLPAGHVVLATFSPDGPEQCSGLPVMRCGADDLAALLGPEFELREHQRRAHVTPQGGTQEFVHVRFTRV